MKSTPDHQAIKEIDARSITNQRNPRQIIKNQRNRRQINRKSMTSTPNHKEISNTRQITKNQRNQRQITNKSTKSTPNHKKINEISAKSQKNQ